MALNTTQARSWWRCWLVMCVQVLLPVAVATATVPANSQLVGAREFQVKAVFLFNFVQFVDWPPEAFESPESPLVIGVLGADPFGSFLDEIVRGEKVNGRPLVVERYRTVADLRPCHLLFVSGSEGREVARIADAVKGHPTLTVCDWDAFSRHGVMIRFVMERNHVRLRINLEAARAAGLTISSKLLRSAEIVSTMGE